MRKKNILIIEDNFEIREGTSEILELTGYYNVLTAENGRVGVEMALENTPDLILCDIMMPELDGYGVLYMLSKHEQTATIPFIFLTAKSERIDMRKAMEMGADDYLTKPFDDVELLNAIESRLKKRGQVVAKSSVGSGESHLSDEEQHLMLKELIDSSRIKEFKKKQLVFELKDNPIFVYYIIIGKVRSFLSYSDGRELSTDIYVRHDFFGYEAVLLNEEYTDSAIALEDSEIALIPKDDFYELLFRKPAIAGKFIKLLSGNLKEKEEKLLELAYDSVRKRVANALIDVAEKTRPDEDGGHVLHVSREELATLAGTANETISRILADFKEANLIKKKGNAIRISSVNNLRQIR